MEKDVAEIKVQIGKIDATVNKIVGVLHNHSKRFDAIDIRFNSIEKTLAEHGKMLFEHGQILADHGKMLAGHGKEIVGIKISIHEMREDTERIEAKVDTNSRLIGDCNDHLSKTNKLVERLAHSTASEFRARFAS